VAHSRIAVRERSGTRPAVPHRSPPHGFTLVELLATIAILTMLFAILLPAVNYATEAARMATCSGRLRELALASNRFEMQRGYFPPATVGSAHCFMNNYHGYFSFPSPRLINMNGLVLLLPFLDQLAVYNAANRESSFCQSLNNLVRDFGEGHAMTGHHGSNGNDAINRTVLPNFICPTATAPRIGAYACWGARTNFDFVTTSDQAGYHSCNLWGQYRKDPRVCPPPGTAGNRNVPRCLLMLSGDESDARPNEVLDGLSNVLMFAETTSRGRCNGADNFWSFRAHSSYGVEPGLPMNVWVLHPGHGASGGCPWSGCCNVAEPSRPLIIVGRQDRWGMPGSQHPGGASVAMADGAVRFVEESIAPGIRLQLARIADGNSPSLDP